MQNSQSENTGKVQLPVSSARNIAQFELNSKVKELDVAESKIETAYREKQNLRKTLMSKGIQAQPELTEKITKLGKALDALKAVQEFKEKMIKEGPDVLVTINSEWVSAYNSQNQAQPVITKEVTQVSQPAPSIQTSQPPIPTNPQLIPQVEKDPNKALLASLKEEVNKGFTQEEIKDEADLVFEISSTKKKIEDLIQRDKTKQVEPEKAKLIFLEDLQNKLSKIKQLERLLNNPGGPEEIIQLENPAEILSRKIYKLLDKNDIKDVQALPKELESAKAALESAQKGGKSKQIQQAQNTFDEINELIKSVEEYKGVLETQLKQGLEDLDITDRNPDNIKLELSNAETELEAAKAQGKQNKIKIATQNLENIRNLLEIYNEFLKFNPKKPEETSPPEILPEDPNQKKSRLIDSAIENMTFQKDLPECFEKLVLRLCYYYALILNQSSKDEIYNVTNFADVISKDSKALKAMYDKEGNINAKVLRVVEQVSSQGTNPASYQTNFEELFSILELVRPFCFQEFFSLVSETEDSAKAIADQRIILLLGSTGCGKSTTIHYLCGSTMREVKMKQRDGSVLPHIEPTQILNKDLERVITKPEARSVTRFVTPINISFKKGFDNYTIVLVDTPGTGDTQSCEVDLANAIGIIKAIKQAESVHPVLIFSYRNFGARYEVLKAQIQYYARMINNVKQNISNFNYFFSHIPKEYEESLVSILTNVRSMLLPTEQNDPSLKLILENMIEKLTIKKAQVIKPTDGQHNQVLTRIYDTEPVQDPYAVFKLNISGRSSEAVRIQVGLHEKQIISAVKRGEEDLALWKIEELNKLKDILKHDQIFEQKYQDCLQAIDGILHENFDKSVNLLSRCLSPGNTLTEDDIELFKKSFEFASRIEKLRTKYLSDLNSRSCADIISQIVKAAQETIEKIQNYQINHPYWIECLQKVSLMSKSIPEFIPLEKQCISKVKEKAESIFYQTNNILANLDMSKFNHQESFSLLPPPTPSGGRRETFHRKFLESDENNTSTDDDHLRRNGTLEKGEEKINAQKIQKTIKQNMLKKLSKVSSPQSDYCELIMILIQARREFSGFKELASFIHEKEQFYPKNIKRLLFEKVQGSLAKLNEPEQGVKLPILSDQDIQDLQTSLNMLDAFNLELKKVKDLDSKSKEVYDEVVKRVMERFETLTKSLFEEIGNPKQTQDVKEKFDQIKLLRSISHIVGPTNSSFFSLQSLIQNKITDFKRQIEQILEFLHQTQTKNDYHTFKKLREAVKGINDLKNLLEDREAFIKSTREDMKKIFEESIGKLEEEVAGKSVSTENCSNLDEVANVYNQIQEIYQIAQILSFHSDLKQDVGKEWINQIESSLEEMLEFSKSHHKQILLIKEYRKVQDYFNYLEQFQIRKSLQKIDFKHKWNDLLKILQELLSSQYDLLFQELTQNFNFITNQMSNLSSRAAINSQKENQNSEEEQKKSFDEQIEKSAGALYTYLKLVTDVEAKFPQLFKYIDDEDDDSKKLKQQFTKKLIEFGREQSEIPAFFNANVELLTQKIQIIRQLRDLDALTSPTEKIFNNAYQNTFNQLFHDPSKEISKAIENYNLGHYDEIKLQMANLGNAGKNNEHFQQIFDKIKIFINRQALEALNDIRKNSFTEHELTADQVKIISEKYGLLINIDEHLGEYIDQTKVNINTIVKQVFERVASNFNTLLSFSQEEIKYHRFFEAHQVHQNITELLRIIEQNSVTGTTTELSNMSKFTTEHEKLKQQKSNLEKTVQTLLESYVKNQFVQYSALKPKSVLDNIRLIKSFHQQHLLERLLKDTEDKLIDKYRQALIECTKESAQDTPDQKKQKQKKFKEIQDSLAYISDQVKIQIQPEIDKILQEKGEKILRQRSIIDMALQKEDLDQILSLVQNIENELQPDQQLKVEQELSRRLADKCDHVKQALSKFNIGLAFNYLEEAQEYITNENLNKCLTASSRVAFSNVIKLISGQFSSCMNELSRFFSEGSMILVSESQILMTGRNSNLQREEGLGSSLNFEIAINVVETILRLSRDRREVVLQVIPDLQNIIQAFLQNSTNYLNKLNDDFTRSMEKENMKDVVATIQNMKQSDFLIQNGLHEFLKEIYMCDSDKQKLNEAILCFNIQDVKSLVLDWINKIGQHIQNQVFINDKTSKNQSDRVDFYKNVQKLYQDLKFSVQHKDTLQVENSDYDIENIFKDTTQHIEAQINKINNQVDDLIRNLGTSMSPKDYELFRLLYVNLKCIRDLLAFNKMKINESIDKIELKIDQKLKEIMTKAQNAYKIVLDLRVVAEQLIELQIMQENMLNFKDKINAQIEEILEDYQRERIKDAQGIANLAQHLKTKGQGATLVEKNKVFKGINILDLNKKFQTKKFEDVLEQLKGDNLDKEGLQIRYKTFFTKYSRIVEQSLIPQYENGEKLPIDLKSIISVINSLVDINARKWGSDQIKKVPELLANIFGLWTLMNAEHYQRQQSLDPTDTNLKNYLLQPHAAQILSIFRILGLGYTSENRSQSLLSYIKKGWNEVFGDSDSREIYDNLVQIKTGEGKSVTLAVVSMVFALHGFDVRCACYSKYLSERDCQAFNSMFNLLGLTESIKYGTFNEICEEQINKEGSIREIIQKLILKEGPQISINIDSIRKPMVLLIDEVDVFFSKDFYGNVYTPSTEIKHPSVSYLIDYIWSKRNERIKINEVRQTEEYKASIEIFNTKYAYLLDEAVKDMICDVVEVDNHDYYQENGMIGYKDQDQISFKISYGYKTMFAYYKEAENGTVPVETLNENKSITINCGQFSYAEIPLKFSIILGVTGTLETLTKSEKHIIKEVYNIRHETYAPSVYGDVNLVYNPKNDIKILDSSLYFNKIVENIQQNLQTTKGNRAVIVFFKNDHKLKEFMDSSVFANYKERCLIINERVDNSEKDNLVQRATYEDQVTLATAAFGRGTDFICRDPKVEESGGVHIIQTFFSEEESEEVQIKGRTSRQGNQGSYILFLLDEDLKAFNIEAEDVNDTADKEKLLKDSRNKKIQNEQKDNTESLKETKKRHDQTESVINLVKQILTNDSKVKPQDEEEIIKFFKEMNLGRLIETKMKMTKTLVLCDATGSMTNLLTKTKNAVGTMFERASQILIDHSFDPNLFMMQFACYRNYSSGETDILQFSPWESKPQNLRSFMDKVQAKGGMGSEAIEVALMHANWERENDNEIPISQIFIIGDAPPNSKDEVLAKRQKLGEKYWKKTKRYSNPTHYEEQMAPIISSGIPVFTFYVIPEKVLPKNRQMYAEQLQKSFLPLTCNGGLCQELDINNEEIGQKLLTDLFTEQILQKIGELNGGQDVAQQLVDSYKKSYKS